MRPFLEARKPRHKESDGSQQLPHSQDGEQVHWVAKLHHDKDDRIAGKEEHWPMDQVRRPTCQRLKRDGCGGHPIADQFQFHQRISFQAVLVRQKCLALHTISSLLSMDGVAMFGAKREMDSTMNGIPITVGRTQNTSVGICFKPGIRWALST